MHRLNLSRPLVFFDLETTGTDTVKDRIVEIALVRIHPDGSRDSLVRRVHPGRPIPPEVSAIHGIYDQDVRNSPRFEEIAPEIAVYFQNADIAGYNILGFDIPLLAEEFLRAGIQPEFCNCHIVDAQQLFFKMERRTLAAAMEFYCGKKLENAHSAAADTQAVVDILIGQLDRYPQLAINVQHLHHVGIGEEPLFDYARRLARRNGEVCYNFGKHNGKTVREVLRTDPGYHTWILDKDFSLHTKQVLKELVAEIRATEKQVQRS